VALHTNVIQFSKRLKLHYLNDQEQTSKKFDQQEHLKQSIKTKIEPIKIKNKLNQKNNLFV